MSNYCNAAIAPQRVGDIRKKMSQINELDGYDAILTWLDAVSMVRAAFESDGGVISINRSIVSGLHNMAGGTKDNGNGSRDKSSSDEAALSARLGSLGQRMSDIRDNRKIGTDQPGYISENASPTAPARV